MAILLCQIGRRFSDLYSGMHLYTITDLRAITKFEGDFNDFTKYVIIYETARFFRRKKVPFGLTLVRAPLPRFRRCMHHNAGEYGTIYRMLKKIKIVKIYRISLLAFLTEK